MTSFFRDLNLQPLASQLDVHFTSFDDFNYCSYTLSSPFLQYVFPSYRFCLVMTFSYSLFIPTVFSGLWKQLLHYYLWEREAMWWQESDFKKGNLWVIGWNNQLANCGTLRRNKGLSSIKPITWCPNLTHFCSKHTFRSAVNTHTSAWIQTHPFFDKFTHF